MSSYAPPRHASSSRSQRSSSNRRGEPHPAALDAGVPLRDVQEAVSGTLNVEQSRFVLHDTTDADVFIAEIDTVLDHPAGKREPISLVQIFRIRDGRIALLRDYFTP
jgi:uncharacterized protein